MSLQVMGLSSPGKAEIVSLDSGNIDDILSKSSEFYWLLFRFAYSKFGYNTKPAIAIELLSLLNFWQTWNLNTKGTKRHPAHFSMIIIGQINQSLFILTDTNNKYYFLHNHFPLSSAFKLMLKVTTVFILFFLKSFIKSWYWSLSQMETIMENVVQC